IPTRPTISRHSRPMHIAVEATRLPHDRRGIGRYMRNLLRAMPAVRSDVRYTLHVRPDDVAAMRTQLASMAGVAERAVVEPLAKLRDSSADVAWYPRSEEHTSELQSRENLVCRLLLEKKKITT